MHTLIIVKRKFNIAKGQVRQIKELDTKDPTVKLKVAELEQALKSRPQGMQAMMYKGMGGKGQRIVRQQPGTTQKKSNNRKSSSKRKKKK